MSNMTDKQARALESIAARLLVAVDERDFSVLADFSKTMNADQITAIMELTQVFSGSEVIKSEQDEETKTIAMYAKSEVAYQFSRITLEEQGKVTHVRSDVWTSEEDFSDEIVW